jgi:hypothetical protein
MPTQQSDSMNISERKLIWINLRERAPTALNRLPMLWTLRLGTKSKKTENDRRTNPAQPSVRSQQRDSGASKPCELAIECDQPVTPSLSRLMGNDAVGEITTLFEEA